MTTIADPSTPRPSAIHKDPLVSILIPAYRSEQTIRRSLETMCAQSYPAYEVIVVDSSPDERTQEIVRERFPGVIYHRNRERLLPHAARNRAVELAHGELLVFTDPDIYAPPGWLSALVQAHHRRAGVIAGALACYGRRPIELAMHLCKFDLWLPGGGARRASLAASANMLCDRRAFEAVGGFEAGSMLADTLISWDFVARGIPIWFFPQAVVEHHHLGTWRDLLRERFSRGAEFGELRLARGGWSRSRALAQAFISLFPLRLARLLLRGAANAWRAGCFPDYLRVSPVVVGGQAAWLAGEARAYLRPKRSPS